MPRRHPLMGAVAWLAGVLGGRSWLAWLIVAVMALGSVGGLYAWIDHGGYSRASAEWSVKYERRENEIRTARFKELDRQAAVNDAAKAREAIALAAEAARADALDKLIAGLNAAADEDPNRDDLCLGADSVERLNRIR